MSRYYETEDELFKNTRASNALSQFTAEYEETPPALLEKLASHRNYRTRVLVARNPNTPVQVLYGLADDNMRLVILNVARNPLLPDELKITLARHKYWGVRVQIAKSSHPEEAALLLMQDENAMVRSQLAGNVSTLPRVLATLSEDEESFVVEAVALNPSTPVAVLLKLLGNSNSKSSEYAATTFASLGDETIKAFLKEVFNEEIMLPREWLIKLATEGYFNNTNYG